MATPLILTRACQIDPAVSLDGDAQKAAKPKRASHHNSKNPRSTRPHSLSEQAVIRRKERQSAWQYLTRAAPSIDDDASSFSFHPHPAHPFFVHDSPPAFAPPSTRLFNSNQPQLNQIHQNDWRKVWRQGLWCQVQRSEVSYSLSALFLDRMRFI